MSTIRVIGMDPSLRNFGFCKATVDLDTFEVKITGLVLVETEADKKNAKVVRKNCDDLDRAQLLHAGVIGECVGHALAFAEVPVGSQSSRAMASYGICVGVLAACPIPMIPVTPSEVKFAATGSKHAAKQEMIEWAVEKYPDAPWLRYKSNGKTFKKGDIHADNEHLADACAAIHAGINTDQFRQAANMMKALAA